jgi:nucleoside-diphosphate-sugar epimerase
MRVLVTGAAGFIGSHVAEALLEAGHRVVGVDGFIDHYPRSIKERNLEAALIDPHFSFHELDLRTADIWPLLEGVDAIVHEAAMPGLPKSWTRFDDYLSCNLTATQRLIEAARSSRLERFVHISTSSVYGNVAEGDEEATPRPASPYGVTKLAGEQLLQAYGAAFGLPYVILRYFSIYGPRQRPDMAYHIFIEALLAGRPITIYGDGTRSRTSTYVDDCVRGTLLALEGARDGMIYNIGGDEQVTVNEVVGILGDLLGVEPDVEHAPDRVGDQIHTRADTRRARDHFGYRPSVSIREGLRRQVEWHRSLATRTARS